MLTLIIKKMFISISATFRKQLLNKIIMLNEQ